MTRLAFVRVAATAIALVFFASALAAPLTLGATNDTIGTLVVVGSPFTPDGDGLRDQLGFRLVLNRKARITLTIRRKNGTLVRTLARDQLLAAGSSAWTWDGRNTAGSLVRDNEYRVRAVAVNSLGTAKRTKSLRKGLPPIFAARPAAITVAINAGHGGSDPGAQRGGYREADFNLDTSLRLQALLESVGVKVVMIRTTDTDVNKPPTDVTGDGIIDHADELAARNDIANLARADVYINPHNNSDSCHCIRGTSTYTNKKRTWSPWGIELAQLVQQQQLLQLASHNSAVYHPIDRGIRYQEFYVMRPYQLPLVPRPALMPSILTESLYVDSDIERALLIQPAVRYSLAMAMYVGLANYFNGRQIGVRYQLLSAPTGAQPAGGKASFSFRLTNNGNLATSGWTFQLRAVPAVDLYDGSGARGTLLAKVGLPNGIAPGATHDVTLSNVTLPGAAGDWLLKADIRRADGSWLSDRGLVALQLPLTTGNP
jgi:N-acetylmuramoyl-L-alanine amidase